MRTETKVVVNLTRGNVACDEVTIAHRARHRMRGLLGRTSLPAGEGMLLQPAPSIHTAFMKFPIDALFMDGTLRVLKTVRRLPPWRAASARGAWAVLELAADEIARREITPGDQLGVVDLAEFDGHGSIAGRWTSLAPMDRDVAALEASDSGRTARVEYAHVTSAELGSDITRVLVVGKDRRFRSVAAALLTRRGCAVMLGDATTDLAKMAHGAGADVVVLDAGASLRSVAQETARIAALHPDIGVVVVGDEPVNRRSTTPVLAKWGSFETLYGAIERARPPEARSVRGGER